MLNNFLLLRRGANERGGGGGLNRGFTGYVIKGKLDPDDVHIRETDVNLSLIRFQRADCKRSAFVASKFDIYLQA